MQALAEIVYLSIVLVGAGLLMRASRPGPIPKHRPFDITYPLHPVSTVKRKKKR